MDEEGVKGTLCADARGLCVQAKGMADPNAAGFFTSLVRRANTLAALAPTHTQTAPSAGEEEVGGGGGGGCTILIETQKL